MSRNLVEIITEQTIILLHNVNTTIQTCDMNYILCERPVWKHVYHALHSADRWLINPEHYDEPSCHEQNLNSLDIKSEKVLTQNELLKYYDSIHLKVMSYLDALTDEMLSEKPDGCNCTRLALILGQYRHVCYHMGNINATTMILTGKWPRVVGLDGDLSKGMFE